MGAPPRRASTSPEQLTADAIAVLMLAIGVVYGSNLESVRRLQLHRLQKRIQYSGNLYNDIIGTFRVRSTTAKSRFFIICVDTASKFFQFSMHPAVLLCKTQNMMWVGLLRRRPKRLRHRNSQIIKLQNVIKPNCILLLLCCYTQVPSTSLSSKDSLLSASWFNSKSLL